MSTFSWMYNLYTLGGMGTVYENQHFFPTLLTFCAWFLLFSWGLALKNVDVYSFFKGRGSQKVYDLYTHENVDIYGWPLITLCNFTEDIPWSWSWCDYCPFLHIFFTIHDNFAKILIIYCLGMSFEHVWDNHILWITHVQCSHITPQQCGLQPY